MTEITEATEQHKRRAGMTIPEIRNALRRHGFAVIPENAPELASREAMGKFGRILSLPGLAELQSLELREKEHATPNTYSGNYGCGEFPLHTDLAHWSVPPRYFVLRCVVATQEVPTRLIDGHDLIEVIGELKLSRAIMQPRRPLAGQRSLLRLLYTHAGTKLLRWDELFIAPVTSAGRNTFEAVKHYLKQTNSIEVILSRPGDTAIIDNWRMLHGRASASGVAIRRLDRVYIDELEGE